MSNWNTDALPGYRTKCVEHKHCTIIIHRPELTKEERARREDEVMRAAVRLLTAKVKGQ